ncbi:hypothetical protein FQN57_004825 [Myotisia sp. PD_48]|nr:hypothetical protein FQN57_004825 [Myotisia sp. PD_48]
MHSLSNRFQTVFGFFTTVAFVLGLLTATSVIFHPANPVVDVQLSNLQVIKGRPHYYSTKREEYAKIQFDLDADFSSLFNWNTKQVFVYVLARYPSPVPFANQTTTTSESIIWDNIISARDSPFSFETVKAQFLERIPFGSSKQSSGSKQKRNARKNSKDSKKKNVVPGKLNLKKQRPKYQITDVTGSIAEKTGAQLLVGWNVQPWIGPLRWSSDTNIARNLGGRFGKAFTYGVGSAGRSKPFDFPPVKGKKTTSK